MNQCTDDDDDGGYNPLIPDRATSSPALRTTESVGEPAPAVTRGSGGPKFPTHAVPVRIV